MDSPLKWHGGKHYLARKIVRLMPPHLHYVEPYAGGLSVMLMKDPEGVSEVANDMDRHLTNFWCVLGNADYFSEFVRAVEATPFSEAVWKMCHDFLAHPFDFLARWPVLWARYFFVACRQSHAGRMDGFAALSRRRTRRGMNEQVAAWLSAVEGLPEVHARLKRVAILCRPALDVIRQQDGPDTLFYLDPPYVPGARSAPDVYAHEMSAGDHVLLLSALAGCKGKWMLSGYANPLYDQFFEDFPHTLHTFDLPNNAASGPQKRRMSECLWCNFKEE